MAEPSPECLSCGARRATLWTVATDAEYKTSAERFSLFHCDVCGVLFLDPVPRDRLGEIYPANYYSYAEPRRSVVTRVKAWLDGRLFARLVRDIPGAALSALDVGGGAGWHLDALKAIDPRVRVTQVVDLDPGAERAARAKGHGYHCGRIEDYATDQRFDLVLLLNLIEHVDDPGGVLTRVRGMLSPHGVALVKTPTSDSWDARVFRDANWAGFHCPRHWVLFTRESFADLAHRAGLRVVSSQYTQGAPFWAASVLGWLDARGLARITPERPVVQHPSFPLLNAAFAALDFARMPFAPTSQMFFVLGREG